MRRPARAGRGVSAGALALFALLQAPAFAQSVTFTESFTGTSAPGWVFGGNYTPWLTAGSNPNGGPGAIDPVGDGWLRLTDNANNRSTFALLDTEIFSVNARIEITMEYAFWNGTGADGITFFLVDGRVNASTFQPGGYGGSLGYAQRDGIPGMPGGYLGFGFDNFGNFSNPTEGRVGGTGMVPNAIAVRGPESSNYAFIAGSGPLQNLSGGGQMDFPSATIRPDQAGSGYRAFKIIFDANNQLTVQMKFGASSDFINAFTADLSAFERPETFKIGFTGATGGSTEIHEVRNIQLVSTPWSSGSGAYEWDHGATSTTWGTSNGGETNANWFSAVPANDNRTPTPGSDILFGARPPTGPQTVDIANNVSVRNLTFDTPHNYTLQGTGTITLGRDADGRGLPSINVNNYNEANANGLHRINNNLVVQENLAVRNFSFSTLCLNGAIDLGSRSITTSGYGAINFNGQITGSGPIVINGAVSDPVRGQGIVTISGNNASSYTGAITVNRGQLVVGSNGALGNTAVGTTVNDGGTLTFRGGISTAEPLTLRGGGATLGNDAFGAPIRAGALYNDGGNNTLSGSITLAANTAIGSRDGTLTLTGALGGGSRDLIKIGDGTVHIQSAPGGLHGAAFVIQGGTLRFDASSFSTAMNYRLDGGVLGLGQNLTIGFGTGNNALRWTGDGGFAAYGADRTVALDWWGGNVVNWGTTTHFVQDGRALILGSNTATHTLTLENPINLGSSLREIRVIDGVSNATGAVDGRLSGAITGTGGLLVTGNGTLDLSSTSNTYSGATVLAGGALRGNVSPNSNLQLAGGVRELGGNASLNLGSGAGQVRWTGDGGFSATGGARSLTLNGGAGLTWGGASPTAGFVAAGNTLVFGSTSADNTVTLTNALTLGGTAADTRTIRTVAGTNASAASGALSGVVSGAAGLAVTGNGRLDLSAANTHSGAVTVTGAELRLTGSGTLAQSSGFVVRQGGSLVLDNASTIVGDRVGNNAGVTLSGGTLSFIGSTSNNTQVIETIGGITLTAASGNTIEIERRNTNPNSRHRLTAASLTREAGSTVNFTASSGTLGGGVGSNNPTLTFTTAPALEQTILPYATVNGAAFAGYNTTDGIVAVAGTNTGQGDWTASTIAAPTSSQALAANRTVGALNLGNAINVTGAHTLTVQTGGILATGTASTISTSVLNVGGTGNRELITHVYGTGGLTISSSIQNNGNVTGLTKTGDGTLTLSGGTANTYTGLTTVNAGTLVLGKTAGVNAIAGDGNSATPDLLVGDGRGIDTVRLGASEQIANTAHVVLRGGDVGASDGRAVLDLNGQTETFHTLRIEGHSILDFSGGTSCAPTFLRLTVLDIAANAVLTIRNWIEFTDFLLVEKTSFDPTQMPRVVFDGYGGEASWRSYDSTYFQIMPFAPVPEPSAYGALAALGLAGWFATRRRRRSALS